MNQINQNIYHRQSTSLLQKHFETRKNSPITLIRAPGMVKRIPLSGSTMQIRTPYADIKFRMLTQNDESKYNSTLKQEDSSNQNFGSFADIRQDKLSLTKTTFAESMEEEKQQPKKNKSSFLTMQKLLLDRDLEIIQMQRIINTLKEQNRKLTQENNIIKKDNITLKCQVQQLEQLYDCQNTNPQGRVSDYICVLTDIDKKKIESLLN